LWASARFSDLGTLSANKNQIVGDGVLDVPSGLWASAHFSILIKKIKLRRTLVFEKD